MRLFLQVSQAPRPTVSAGCFTMVSAVTNCDPALLQITELATKCSHLQQEKELLEDKADSDAGELALLRDQLAAAQASSSSMAVDLASAKAAAAELQQKAAAEGDAHAAALMVIVSRDKEIAELRRQVAAAEATAQGSHMEHSQQVSGFLYICHFIEES